MFLTQKQKNRKIHFLVLKDWQYFLMPCPVGFDAHRYNKDKCLKGVILSGIVYLS